MRHKMQLAMLVAIGTMVFVLNAWSLLGTRSDHSTFSQSKQNVVMMSTRTPERLHPGAEVSKPVRAGENRSGEKLSGASAHAGASREHGAGDKSSEGVPVDIDEEAGPEIFSEKQPSAFTSPDNDHLHGILGQENGPIWSPTPLRKKLDDWTAEESRSAHEQYCFNHVLSDSLPLDREPFDSRSLLCSLKSSPTMQPATIIFVFFDELFSTLLRSVHSALNTAPPHLIGEIVLVDDGSNLSTRPLLGTFLENYVKRGLPKTRLVRLRNRAGLMRARMHGASIAKFSNLIFLDSHIECGPGWIEPLLAQLTQDYRNVALPVIESIEPHDFSRQAGGIEVLGHSWRLGQVPIPNRSHSDSSPNDSPIMAGGLFAITKRWFDEIGQYDPEMQQYGGEEMEISLKIWQCGGKLRSIPCSRIGHVFRTSKYWQGQVYPVNNDIIVRNKLRAAGVWMDDAAKIVNLAFSPLPASLPLGDLAVPRKVRDNLQCHDYNWYHQNVYPELFFPDMENAFSGALRSIIPKKACVDTLMEQQLGNAVGLYPCHYAHGSQAFLLSGNGMLRVAVLDFTVCLSLKAGGLRGGDRVILDECRESGKWTFEGSGKGVLKQGDKCLQAVEKPTLKSPYSLSAAACSDDSTLMWEWV